MALAERAELTARLTLKDELSGTARRASSNFSSSMGKIRSTATKGVQTAATNIGRIGLIAAAVIGAAVKSGVSSLAELEDAVTSVDGAIKQVGTGWTITGAQIASIANEIETDVQRAFDDKEITQATTTLIRYGKISEANLRPAMEVMTDLAAKTGDVDSASTLLAKALADPAKAAGKLARVGIVLTKEQQKQIAAFVKAGKVGKAQKVLLDALAKSTKGAAAASAGPYRDSINILRDVWEDATRALATGFLPVIKEVADVLSEELAKPETLRNIKAFGDNMAGGVRGLVSAVRGVDWNAIGGSLKIAGTGAKAVYDAFMGMPDWVKTAVLTGWGLNKLTGGAVSSILGSGIEVGLKGVFGQFFARGASPANPMWVASATGGVGGAPVGGAGGGVLGTLAKVVLPVTIVAVAGQAVLALAEALNPPGSKPSDYTAMGGNGTRGFVPPTRSNPLPVNTGGLSPDERQEYQDTRAAIDALDPRLEAIRENALRTKAAVDLNRINTIAVNRTGDASIVAAIRGIQRPIVNVRVNATSSLTRVSYITGSTLNRYEGKALRDFS